MNLLQIIVIFCIFWQIKKAEIGRHYVQYLEIQMCAKV